MQLFQTLGTVRIATAPAAEITPLKSRLNSISTAESCGQLSHEFVITKRVGTFAEARLQCQEMGGDLVTESMGEAGVEYHE